MVLFILAHICDATLSVADWLDDATIVLLLGLTYICDETQHCTYVSYF